MENNIVFYKGNVNIEGFDDKSNTLLIENQNDKVFYICFDNYVPDNMKIDIVNSNVTIIETYNGKFEDLSFSINVDEKSSLNRFSIIVDTNNNLVVNRVVNNKGKYISMQIDLTDNNVDSNEDINLEQDGALANVIDGIYAIENASKNYKTNLNHNVANATSDAKIFAINNDEANISIYTDAYIKKGAIHTKTTQEGRIINLSSNCYGIVLPNLHIDENDVEASHSCSVGSLNQDHIYYLESRGLLEDEARNVLIKGYFNPILQEIENKEILNKLNEILDKRIGK